MPSIKDISTVNLIATLFCGVCKRNKTQTLIKAGYSKGYADNGAGHRVFGNVRVKAAIKAIDDKMADEMDLSRKAQHQRLLDIVQDETTPKSVRVSALRELNEMLGYHRDKAPNEERQRAVLDHMTLEEIQLAEIVARLRTRQESMDGPKLVDSVVVSVPESSASGQPSIKAGNQP